MAELRDLIAGAIQDADRSYFNEDYGRQANAVLVALRRAGYEVVPTAVPSETFIAFIIDNLPFGRLRPSELVRQLYALMVANVRRFDGRSD